MNLFVKVCGITRPQDALKAVQLGASAIGFIFDPSSPRYISPEKAREVSMVIGDKAAKVGVFVNSPVEFVQTVAAQVGLDRVQLHGDETPADCGKLKALDPIKAFHLEVESDLNKLENYKDVINAFLLDSRTTQARGGTGIKADWGLVQLAAQTYPVIVAGGLRPENVGDAVKTLGIIGVDVSSGVESSPGVKDEAKLQLFFQAVFQKGS